MKVHNRPCTCLRCKKKEQTANRSGKLTNRETEKQTQGNNQTAKQKNSAPNQDIIIFFDTLGAKLDPAGTP